LAEGFSIFIITTTENFYYSSEMPEAISGMPGCPLHGMTWDGEFRNGQVIDNLRQSQFSKAITRLN
jgi:hypothetical protein